jgi:hypothetical protein
MAFISIMIAVPLQVSSLAVCCMLYVTNYYASQNALGDGGLYTAWAGILVVVELLVLLVIRKGESWRKESEENESGSDT